jgi:hypothetical protein
LIRLGKNGVKKADYRVDVKFALRCTLLPKPKKKILLKYGMENAKFFDLNDAKFLLNLAS